MLRAAWCWWALLSACVPSSNDLGAHDALAHVLDAAFVRDGRVLTGGWALPRAREGSLDVGALVGRWSLVGVGYTSCPDVCPAALAAMPSLAEAVSASTGSPLQVVFIAVDPSRDVPALPAYRQHFQEGLGVELIAASGDPSNLGAAAADLGLGFEVRGDEVQHSTAWALVAPSGHVVGHVLHPTAVARTQADLDAHSASLQAAVHHVEVRDAWLRPPVAGGHIGAAYGRLVDHSGETRQLVSASKVDGTLVAVHETVVVDGLAGMRPARVPLPAHGQVVLQPMGAHLMVPHLRDATEVILRLTFDDGEALWARFGAPKQ